MYSNSFGKILAFTSFGESHGLAVGGILTGFPSGIPIDMDFIRSETARRKPSQSIGSGRNEEDIPEILSGIFEGKSLGTPIAFIIRNKDAQSKDYEILRNLYRPGHADDTYDAKFSYRDHRGGGFASARQSAAWVVAGAFAKILLFQYNIFVSADISQIGNSENPNDFDAILANIRNDQDSIGGIIQAHIEGLPKGLGEPPFDKLQARLAQAMLSIPACKGFEYGKGFEAAKMKGSQHNDIWKEDGSSLQNLAGGIRGGISTGEKVSFRLAFKPISSIGQEQVLLNKEGGLECLKIEGRHDICCIPRALPIVEALTALSVADFFLLQKSHRL